MTQRNRKTLSGYFSEGQLPTQNEFGELIDSMVNVVDDGFDKSPEDGLKLAQLKPGSKLVSFYEEITVGKPLWSIAFTMPGNASSATSYKNLNIFYASNTSGGLTLANMNGNETPLEQSGKGTIRVGINQNSPQHELDVNGVIVADGRIGREEKKERSVLADGNWHRISDELDGCQAFEVMAGVGKKNSGKYALLHAFALNTFNTKKNSITRHQAHFMSKCDQIELRWTGDTHKYTLEMRTRCAYFEVDDDEKIYVRYFITNLWFDPTMANCSSKQSAAS